MSRFAWPLLSVFALLGLLSCGTATNPPSLWVSYGQTELDLILIDHEPPPF